ncbi:uncharacterized protein PHACADRAFT_264694 [Phanerochaete carnosa HHB-10118-sp]|uniref:Peptidase A1 domain-containing protein n=1 Tax=Phanerochaete carnosa (strain HHB-10118-sp) TaxID=650164 RepID=K5VU73_PHACS|nr:uncharacterized protein PHACADRAFT_264694 [Phanerochaete carnosa HHB-10118-sp]EKM50134.1 hypothetical protein PHACADRAFT_264694 [Phanerochaete carnosa HHB-10118-sp]
MVHLAGLKLALLFGTLSGTYAAGLVKLPVRASVASPSAPLGNKISKLTVSVTTGNDQTFDNVLVDTGSSLLWVGASSPYVPGPNSKDTGETFGVEYDEGSATGLVYLDTVTIGSATVTNQYIGAANQTSLLADLDPLDGFIGLSFNGSNAHTISGIDGPTNTFFDSLVEEGVIEQALWSMVVPALDVAAGQQVGEGEILFGGYDASKVEGDIAWLDVTNEFDQFTWAFNMDAIYFGDSQISNDDFVFAYTDSGNIWLSLNIDSYLAVQKSVPGAAGASIGPAGEIMAFPANASLADLPSISYSMAGQNFTLTPEQYVMPSSAYATFGITDDGRHYTWFASAGSQADAILGQAWLQYFYSIYDVGNTKIGFANYA